MITRFECTQAETRYEVVAEDEDSPAGAPGAMQGGRTVAAPAGVFISDQNKREAVSTHQSTHTHTKHQL